MFHAVVLANLYSFRAHFYGKNCSENVSRFNLGKMIMTLVNFLKYQNFICGSYACKIRTRFKHFYDSNHLLINPSMSRSLLLFDLLEIRIF